MDILAEPVGWSIWHICGKARAKAVRRRGRRDGVTPMDGACPASDSWNSIMTRKGRALSVMEWPEKYLVVSYSMTPRCHL